MSVRQFFDKRMRSHHTSDEPLCLICHASMDTFGGLYDLETHTICQDCMRKMSLHKKVYLIHQVEWHVLYEYNDFLERLFFQFKEQRDRALSGAFLEPVKDRVYGLKRYQLCAMCSGDKKRMERGFEPIIEIFQSVGLIVESPFFKSKDIKQSQASLEKRHMIQNVIERKRHYHVDQKSCVLVDDVCTTGATLQRGLALLPVRRVLVLAAHPLWIQEHQSMRVEKKGLFW